jgi:hypothetical protein
METKQAELVSEAPAGRSPKDFARATGISRTAFYILPADCKPASVKIGRRLIITESPADWLARMTARGGVQTRPAKAAA